MGEKPSADNSVCLKDNGVSATAEMKMKYDGGAPKICAPAAVDDTSKPLNSRVKKILFSLVKI